MTSLTTPINWRQENLRVDYNMSKNLRAMVRYTQDAWENNSPSLQSNLWGDDPFPAVDSNWNQPGRSFIAQLNQTIGSSATNSLQFSYSGNSITVTRGGTDPGLNDQINAAIPSLFSDVGREYPTDRGHPVFWGGAGYDTLWNEAPFHNNQDLFVLKDDYSAVFGKHLLKVGGLVSFNRKNEDVGGYGSYENSEFWGSTGLGDTGVTSGQPAGRLPAEGHAVGVRRVLRPAPGATALAGRRVLRLRLVENRAARDARLRRAATRCS